MTDLIDYSGALTGIEERVTRQGRPWVTALLRHKDGESKLLIYPNAYEALGGRITEGAEAAVTIHPTGSVAAMSLAGHSWREPTAEDDDEARRWVYAYLANTGTPWGDDPVPLASVLTVASQNKALEVWPSGVLTKRGKARLRLLLFFVQGHHLAHFSKPLFTEPLYATQDGVGVDLPEPAGEHPSNGQWNSIDFTFSRYGEMDMADLRSLVRISSAWRSAYGDSADGGGSEINLVLLREWFTRDEEVDDPLNSRPGASLMAAWAAERDAERPTR
jgi:hypothetical protein